MRRSPHRLTAALGAVLFATILGTAVASAQEGEGEGEGEPGGTIIVDSGAPVSTFSPRTVPTTVPPSTLPAGCPKPIEPAVVFSATYKFFFTDERSRPYFQVNELASGSLDGRLREVRPPSGPDQGQLLTDLVQVDFGNDVNFLHVGTKYLVAAGVDKATDTLVSKVQRKAPRFGENQVIGLDDGGVPLSCPIRVDNVITKLEDGTEIESGLVSGLSGKKQAIGLAFLIPALICLGALVVLTVLRRTFRGAGRSLLRFVRRRSAKGRRRRAMQRARADIRRAERATGARAETAGDDAHVDADDDPWEAFAEISDGSPPTKP